MGTYEGTVSPWAGSTAGAATAAAPVASTAAAGARDHHGSAPRAEKGSDSGLPDRMDQAPLILICDHRGEGLAEDLAPLAAAGFEVETTTNLRRTLQRLATGRFAALVVHPLAAGGAVELEAIEQGRPHDPPTPVLVVADPEDPKLAVLGARALVSGLWDVVHKDAPYEEYLMRIRQLGVVHDLRHRAAHDDRTDLLRPQAFEARLAEHVSAAQRHHLDIALLILDIDKFKRINDDHDHTVGDLVIEQIGAAIRSTLRAEDIAGRLGGDEFGVLLPYTGKLETTHVVQRLLDAIKALSGRPRGARSEVRVSASIGFETSNGQDLDSVEELRAHAETALREAKRLGGNQGVYYRSLGSTADQ